MEATFDFKTEAGQVYVAQTDWLQPNWQASKGRIKHELFVLLYECRKLTYDQSGDCGAWYGIAWHSFFYLLLDVLD